MDLSDYFKGPEKVEAAYWRPDSNTYVLFEGYYNQFSNSIFLQ